MLESKATAKLRSLGEEAGATQGKPTAVVNKLVCHKLQEAELEEKQGVFQNHALTSEDHKQIHFPNIN